VITDRVTIDVHLDEEGALASMAEEVRLGLTRKPKALPCKYFYDERGSWLFERITELPEYYQTRAERRVLDRIAGEVAEVTRPEELLELGSGSASKTRLLLEAGRDRGELRRYVPVDVSEAMVEHSARKLCEEYSWIEVHGVVGDFERHLDQVPEGRRRLAVLLGGTIGNFLRAEAASFLADVASLLGADGHFLLGTDLVKDRARLEAAYNDSEGVTADFNRNVLRVINHRLEGDFTPERFEHIAFYDEERERIELHLESAVSQMVRLDALDLDVSFDEGERTLTEVSCKYTRDSVEALLAEAGLVLDRWFTDEGENFAVSLSRPA
jgi:L-histidine N-alpha-methyltransferase